MPRGFQNILGKLKQVRSLAKLFQTLLIFWCRSRAEMIKRKERNEEVYARVFLEQGPVAYSEVIYVMYLP
jgi:hypothetical protein